MEPKQFKRRRNIERATKFKVQFTHCGEAPRKYEEREFDKLKSMSQWIARNEEEYMMIVCKTLALIDDQWEPFTTIGKKTVTLSELKTAISNLCEDYSPSKCENEVF